MLLVAGLSYAFYERGSPTGNGTLPDTFLTLLDAQGNELAFNDDSANTANSFFEYTPEETGFYAVEAGAFSSNTGSYQVIVGAGRGNNVANFIVGTDVSDNVQGLGGNDIINGELGLDRLYGGNGSDNIDGGGGGDLMSGEKGNDRYFSDNANDRMVEFADGGIDTIFASISRGVDANVENLTMLGNQASWAIGNELANVIRGNELTNAIIGGDGDDWIYGGAGDDRITSGPGADHLVGESGFDSFVFTEAFGRDTVHAFERGSDRLILSGLDADTSALGNQAFAFLGGGGLLGHRRGAQV